MFTRIVARYIALSKHHDFRFVPKSRWQARLVLSLMHNGASRRDAERMGREAFQQGA